MAGNKPNADDMLMGLDLGPGGDSEGGESESDSVSAASDVLDAIEAKDPKALDRALRDWLALADSDASTDDSQS